MAERAYGRFPLLLDSEDGLLAGVSKSLGVLGHPALYADDLDELLGLARERAGQVGALLLPAAHACEWWPVVRKRVVGTIGLAPRSVLVVGARLSESDAEALHCDGLRWALAEPYTPLDLRFAATLVLSEGDPGEPRIEPRVPCEVGVEVESESRALPAQLTDLSTGGAFVSLAHPHQEGTSIALRVALAGRPVSLQARVAWRTGAHTPSWRDRGMGVAFERIPLGALDLLRQEIDCALDRFRLRARARAAGPREAATAAGD